MGELHFAKAHLSLSHLIEHTQEPSGDWLTLARTAIRICEQVFAPENNKVLKGNCCMVLKSIAAEIRFLLITSDAKLKIQRPLVGIISWALCSRITWKLMTYKQVCVCARGQAENSLQASQGRSQSYGLGIFRKN
jgi:hypothetical protein